MEQQNLNKYIQLAARQPHAHTAAEVKGFFPVNQILLRLPNFRRLGQVKRYAATQRSMLFYL